MTETVRADGAPLGPRPRFGFGSQFLYGIGAAAFGIKDNGFRFFLVFFYNQVIGLPILWVTTALAVALAIDSLVDPVIGQMSDHWKSRWGRRHPFMYLAVAPGCILFVLLWMPPAGLSDVAKLAYMVVLAIASRTFITLFEIPSSTLVAELTTDYDQRTRIVGWRVLCAWWGGLILYIFALTVLMAHRPGFKDGRFDPSAYIPYGIVAAIFMGAVMLASAIGTHRFIPWLPKPPPEPPKGPVAVLRDMFQSLASRHLAAILGVAIFAAAAEGVGFSIYSYVVAYFWGLGPNIQGFLGTDAFFGSASALVLAPLLSKGRNKRTVAIWTLIATVILSAAPLVLRLTDLFPTHGPSLVWTLYGIGIVRSALGITCTILIVGMMADVVEDSEARTGKRAEGLIFAAIAFVQKCVTGLGGITTGFILTWAGLSQKSIPGQVSQDSLTRLALGYLGALFLFYGGAILCLYFYRITRESHAATLARIAEAERLVEEGAPLP